MQISVERETITTLSSLFRTYLALCSFKVPVVFTCTLFSAVERDAAPPMWNVRIVSCVPGSPID